MYRGYLNRRRESREHTPQQGSMSSVPTSYAPSPLATSCSSPAGSSVLAGTSNVNTSHSDTTSSDHSVPCTPSSTSAKHRFFPLPFSSAQRSAPAVHMGQGQSRTGLVSHSSSPAAPSTLPLPSSTNRLKRAWGRRKKSEDVTAVLSNAGQLPDDRYGRDTVGLASVSSSVLSSPSSSMDNLQSPPANPPSDPETDLKSPKFSGAPPIPPPKPEPLQLTKHSSPDLEQSTGSPPLVISPGSSAAVLFMSSTDDKKAEVGSSSGAKEKPDSETKQDWRKSDATTMSYVTIRPNALSGTRSPRPVSLAESSHSGHTIVPVNKRLSALITDAEYAMAEEGDSDSESDAVPSSRSVLPALASPSAKSRNRRSASLNIGPGHWSKYIHTGSSDVPLPTGGTPLSRTVTETAHITPSASEHQPTLSKVAARGIIAPTAPPGADHTTGSNIRNHIAAWTVASGEPSSPPPPPSSSNSRRTGSSSVSFRQTAISITGNIAPVAFGLGKRAAEKVHRVWGGLSSGASSHSAYSSTSSLNGSTSGTAPSSYNGGKHGDATSGQSMNASSSLPGGWKSKRRTPNAPSGAWSVSSSVTTLSDADGFSTLTGPILGTCLRRPQLSKAGTPVAGGFVFGRDLRTCVQQTAIASMKERLGSWEPSEPAAARSLEDRVLPALVVRCAQHLHHWGLQEEGLFRLNGRPAHVAKLRSEFDTGADYNLVECDPGDLDPHAVASIFKAYLRELPRPLLTSELIPLFESALAADASRHEAHIQASGAGSTSPGANRGFPMLRKPPSLSTLAMPSFAGMRSISDTTIATLASLVSQLPQENQDLLYTVVELIQATAANSKETRMTLGNLLLVFCPSLNMSPSLLRVLCEAPSIWNSKPASAEEEAPSLTLSQAEADDSRISHYADAPLAPDSSDSASYDSDVSDVAIRRKPSMPFGGVGSSTSELGASGGSPYRSANNSGSGQDDAASYVSALDHPPSPSDASSSNLPALTTSTDSLATPSTMSEASSLQPAIVTTADDTPTDKSAFSSPVVPVIANLGDLSLPPSSRRPFISSPVPFPSTGDSSSHAAVSHRKSLTLLSFPPLGKSDASASETSPTWAHRQRQKRPSLHLLFSRKSASPLSSPSISSPEPIEAPAGMVCVPIATARKDTAPVLDTPILTSPIDLFHGPDSAKDKQPQIQVGEFSRSCGSLPLHEGAPALRERNDSSSGSSLFSTPQQTPIADYFRGQSPSLLSIRGQDEGSLRSRSASPNMRSSPLRKSDTPVISVGIEADSEGDWSQSVLKEAEASSGGDAVKFTPSVTVQSE